MPVDIAQAVIDTIASTFSVDPSTIGPQTNADDVDGWDSLGHTILMVRLGDALGSPVPERVASQAISVSQLVEMLAELRRPG